MTDEVGVLDTSVVIVLHRLADPSILPKARAFDAHHSKSTVLPLYTCNPSDFAGIDGLVLRSVSQP